MYLRMGMRKAKHNFKKTTQQALPQERENMASSWHYISGDKCGTLMSHVWQPFPRQSYRH